MKTHVESIHEGKKPFKCLSCDYSSFRQNVLKGYTAVLTGKEKKTTEFTCCKKMSDEVEKV